MNDAAMIDPKVIQQIRKEYVAPPFNKQTVSPDPFEQFSIWFNDALRASCDEPNAMVLATATREGVPSARTVLLKSFNSNGFVFYTNYLSRKGRELQENPQAALLFYWHELRRQVRLEGRVSRVSAEESGEYFHTRPVESQLSAWASRQSSAIADRSVLEKEYQRLAQEYRGRAVPLPPFWGGYRLAPHTFEFWQGRENRLHDRIAYFGKGDQWQIERLSP